MSDPLWLVSARSSTTWCWVMSEPASAYDRPGFDERELDRRINRGEFDLAGGPPPFVVYHLLAVTGETDDFLPHWDPATVVDDGFTRTAAGHDVTPGWDGSDLFWIRDRASYRALATDRVVRAFAAAGLIGWEKSPSTAWRVLIDDRWGPL